MHDAAPVKVRKRLPGAGRRKGSGKYLEATTVARVPESIARNVDFYYSLPDVLEDLAILWDTRYTGTVRSDVASACAEDLRQLLNVIKRSTT